VRPDARFTFVVASITAPAWSPSVTFNLGKETGKSSCRRPEQIVVADHLTSEIGAFVVSREARGSDEPLRSSCTSRVRFHFVR